VRGIRLIVAIFSFFAVASASGAEAEIRLYPRAEPTTYANLEELVRSNFYAEIGTHGKIMTGGKLEQGEKIVGTLPPPQLIQTESRWNSYTAEWETYNQKVVYDVYVLSSINSAKRGFSMLVRLHFATISNLTSAQIELLKRGANVEAFVYITPLL